MRPPFTPRRSTQSSPRDRKGWGGVGMSQPASGFLEMLGSVAQALSPFKVRAPPTPLRCLEVTHLKVMADVCD